MYKLELQNIQKKFSNKNVLDGLNLQVKKGERISILGPSGCGKSTTLSIIAGLIDDFEGKVILDGEDITSKAANKRNIVIVNQENLLFPHMNVYENIAFGLRVRKKSKDEIDKKVKDLLSDIGLEGYEKKKVSMISGGEKQRVALARALAVEPEVLLLDEAYSSLDTNLRERMRELTIGLQKKHNTTMILVTHDKEEAILFSDRIAIMLNGKLEQIDYPEEVYTNPKTKAAAKFMVDDNFIEIDRATILIKPEDIDIYKEADVQNDFENDLNKFVKENINLEGKIFSAEVKKVVYSGTKMKYILNVGKRTLKVDDFDMNRYEVGDKIGIVVKKTNIYRD